MPTGLALTRATGDPAQQQLVAGFLLLRASSVIAGSWQEPYIDNRGLLQAVRGALIVHLDPWPSTTGPGGSVPGTPE